MLGCGHVNQNCRNVCTKDRHMHPARGLSVKYDREQFCSHTRESVLSWDMQGKYEKAAAAFERSGAAEQVMEMWTDLRQFDKASQWAERVGQGSASVDALRAQQALWSEEVKDYRHVVWTPSICRFWCSVRKKEELFFRISATAGAFCHTCPTSTSLAICTSLPA